MMERIARTGKHTTGGMRTVVRNAAVAAIRDGRTRVRKDDIKPAIWP